MPQLPYRDRREAGEYLGAALARYAGAPGLLVLGLPRGGVPVAVEVARALGAPLDVLVVRKLGVPWQPELAMGAVASGGAVVLNPDVLAGLGLGEQALAEAVRRKLREGAEREALFRPGRPPLRIEGRTVILVDDGIATGSTMRAGLRALRQLKPARLVAAVPVGPWESCELVRAEADEFVCLETPEAFFAVGSWFEDFTQTTDDEVRRLLAPLPQSPAHAP